MAHTPDDYQAKVERLKQIRDMQAKYPGRAPGGTGPTGLLRNDARGWSAMLNEQVEAQNIENELRGKAPLQSAYNYDPSGMPASLGDNPEWWLSTGNPAAGRSVQGNLKLMPASLHGLYAASLASRAEPKTVKK